LDVNEREQLERFAVDRIRLEYLVTRSLCRTTLSRYADVAPNDWRFTTNAWGRPKIATPAATPGLRFNLSNTRKLVACVVTLECDAGIDVEGPDWVGETAVIADQFFAAAEKHVLQLIPVAAQRRRFLELWTLKESYIKARGMGLSIPLDKFSIDVESRPIRICFDDGFEDTPDDWQFELFEPDQEHLIAVGIRRGTRRDMHVRLHELAPFDILRTGVAMPSNS
jgi:4'-phosphopantetheinyl transferase